MFRRFSEGMLTMSYTYTERRRAEHAAANAAERPAAPQAPAQALRAGRMTPDPAGRPFDLPSAIRKKMENAFGTDLSSVRLYESEAVGRAGAEAVARGANIAFAPGEADFHTRAGQALLGHELSHVVSQARGEVRGGGFLNDPALEARADREGELAAAGEVVYAGPVAGTLSDASAAPAAGPIQAKKMKNQELNQMAARLAALRNPQPDSDEDPVASSTASPPAQPVEAAAGDEVEAEEDEEPGIEAVTQSQGMKDVGLFGQGVSVEKQTSTAIDKAAQFGEILAGTDKRGFAKFFTPFSGLVGGQLGVVSGLTGVVTGVANTVRHSQNVAAGASRMDAALSGLDAINSLGGAGAGGLQIASNVGATLGNALPGLSAATGLLSMVTGGIQAARNRRGNARLSEKLHTLNRLDQPGSEGLSANQKRLRQIFTQGEQVTARNAITGTLKLGAGAMGATAGALALTGFGGMGALAAGGLGALTGLGGFIYEKVKNSKIRHRVIDDELGGLDQVRQSLNDPDLSDRQARAILLRSHGYRDTRDAYQQITKKRAQDLFRLATQDDDPTAKSMAEDAIAALGIKKRGGKFQKGAEALLAGKLS